MRNLDSANLLGMIETAFVVGCAALLAAPGPTNALLFASGTSAGPRKCAILAASALIAYLTGVSALMFTAGPTVVSLPWLTLALRTAICLYLVSLAWGLWTQAKLEHPPNVTPAKVAITTLFNPKAAVIAFGLMPQASAQDFALAEPLLVTLSLLVLISSLAWIAAGAFAAQAAPALRRPAVFCRLGAATMLAFAGVMGGSVLASL